MFSNICAPALIYIAFSLTQIIIDTFKGFYNVAFMKIIVMIIIGLLLNLLCKSGMTVISWIIVFIPFILMSFIVALLLYIFGLDVTTGKVKITCDNCPKIEEKKSGNLVYSQTITKGNTDIYYDDHNDTNNNNIDSSELYGIGVETTTEFPFYSSDPQYM